MSREGLSIQFSEFMGSLESDPTLRPPLKLAAKLLSLAINSGFACLSLNAIPKDLTYPLTPEDGQWVNSPQMWVEHLLKSRLVGTPFSTHEITPFVLDIHQRIYLYRYWDYEQRLKKTIRARLLAPERTIHPQTITFLNKLFPDAKAPQRYAVENALRKNLSLLSGGPGTGKTHTIVAFLIACCLNQPTAKIHLAAPTGKAAARMAEAIHKQIEILLTHVEDHEKKVIHESLTLFPTTVHRLLGLRPLTLKCESRKYKLPIIDWLIIDECSMMDLSLATRLFEALDNHTQVLLVGDGHQLISVEAGSIFSELCDLAREVSKTRSIATPFLTELATNHRFNAETAMGQLAKHIRETNIDEINRILNEPDDSLSIAPLLEWESLLPLVLECYQPLIQAITQRPLDYAAIYASINHFKVLTPTYLGRYGVEYINRTLGHHIAAQTNSRKNAIHYLGQLIMITRNERAGLYNGDIGVIVNIPGEGLRALFFRSGPNDYVAVSPALLPAHELAFAMTVHKTQGSEFEHVFFLLPDYAEKLISKRLLYTGITRAKQCVTLFSETSTLLSAFNRQEERTCGLADDFMEDSQRRIH